MIKYYKNYGFIKFYSSKNNVSVAYDNKRTHTNYLSLNDTNCFLQLAISTILEWSKSNIVFYARAQS